MSKRFTYSRVVETCEGMETYTAVEFDSFDEAKTAVDKGIRDRKLELGNSPKSILPPPAPPMPEPENRDPVPTNTPDGAATTAKNPI